MSDKSMQFKASIVWLILSGRVDEALKRLAKNYGVDLPKVKVGLPKTHRKKLGCYKAQNETISVLNSDMLKEPSIILHEFYHHLRTDSEKKHRGTEKKAGEFAKDFIEAYKKITATS